MSRPRAAPAPSGHPIVNLRDGQCRFPVGEEGVRPYRFCGEPAHGTTSWCAHHLARVRAAPGAVAGCESVAERMGRRRAS